MGNQNKATKSRRKSPTQGRSKALVDAILEATVRILPKIGSHNITTKKIAELAGVSVGSLYQYFPNKESVLTAIMEMAIKVNTSDFFRKIEELDGKSMEDCTAIMVDFTLDLFLKERNKVREIYMQAPELGMLPTLLKVRQAVAERLAEEMKKHHPGLDRREYVRVSFIAVNSLLGVIHTMLYDEEQNYSIAELSTELKAMLNGYFQSSLRA